MDGWLWTLSKMKLTKSDILAEATTVNRIHGDVHRYYQMKRSDPKAKITWRKACEELRNHDWLFDQLCKLKVINDIRAQDGNSRESAVIFLELDPWCYRAGYAKERILRGLGGAQLSKVHKTRLSNCMIKVTQGRPRREFRNYCRLAYKLRSEFLHQELNQLLSDESDSTRRQAEWMLGYLDRHTKIIHNRQT